MGGFNDWSTTAASNASVGSMNWSEGQLPATVNNSARQMAADLRYELGAISSTVSAGATVDVGAIPEHTIVLSGNATISSFGTSATTGLKKRIRVTGAPTLAHSVGAITLPSAANLTLAAGDQFEIECEGTGQYRAFNFSKANGKALVETTQTFDINALSVNTTIDYANDTFATYSSASAGPRKASFNSFLAQKPCFLATKNGTDQTGIAPSTPTKLTFTTEEFDIGSFYSAGASLFQPSIAGKYRLQASVTSETTNITDGAAIFLAIYKNGSLHREAVTITSAAGVTHGAQVSAIVDANGTTDYFEVYINFTGSGNKSVDGLVTETWFCGERI